MGILGKLTPSSADTDVVLYTCPVGKQAVVTVNACNVSGADKTVRIGLVANGDLGVGGVTVSAKGTGYTSIPTATVSGTNTTQAAISVATMGLTSAAVNAAGSGYAVGNILTIVGGTGTAATLTVDSVDGSGGVTSATVTTNGDYSALIATASPATVTGGAGTGAKFDTLKYGINSFTVTNKGNGYADVATISVAAQAGASGFVGIAQMAAVTEVGDYIEFDSGLGSKSAAVLERTGLALSAGDSITVRANAGNAVNFAAWGVSEIA